METCFACNGRFLTGIDVDATRVYRVKAWRRTCPDCRQEIQLETENIQSIPLPLSSCEVLNW